MTQDAQAALRRVVEQYSRNTRFCMICNYVTKIIPALQSRCTKFRFAPLQGSQVRSRVDHVIAAERINITPGGVDALLELGNGDMRRILNVLQATAVAAAGSSSAPAAMAVDGDDAAPAPASARLIDRNTVYECTGSPLPDDVDAIVHELLNSTFAQAYHATTKLCREKGYALSDIITCFVETITCMELPAKALAPLLAELANIEYRLSCGASDALNTGALVGAFRAARSATPADVVLAPMAE